MLQWTIEHEIAQQGYKNICGVDEAGRGPLAGPVCAAAVILPYDCQIEGLNDSKKISEKKRDLLFDEIKNVALAHSIAMVDHKKIDEINILQATYLAMKNAVEGLNIKADYALVDGNRSQGLNIPFNCIVKGDAKSPSIAAASILAKVARDRYMLDMAKKYPEYAFEKHKGYGTKAHYDAILEHGACEIHRITFLKKFYEKHPEAKK